MSRAMAIISAIACSAVVMELPNGVSHADPRRGRRNADIVDADAGAPTTRFWSRGSHGGDLGRGTDREPIVVADDLEKPSWEGRS